MLSFRKKSGQLKSLRLDFLCIGILAAQIIRMSGFNLTGDCIIMFFAF